MSLSTFKVWLTVLISTVFTVVIIMPSSVSAAKTSLKKSAKESVKAEEPVNNGSFETREYEIGVALGLWMDGEIAVEDVDLDKDSGPLFRVFVDAYLMPKFAVGCYFNYSSATLSYEDVSADASFYEFGITLKPRFIVSPVVAIKPGLNMGYRQSDRERLEGESMESETDADGMALNLSIEVQYLYDSDYIIFFESGFLSQPTGGNADADVTWAPIIYLAVGICF